MLTGKNERLKYKRNAMMLLASSLGGLSTCAKREVGCVIASEDFRSLYTGYNGPASGEPFCDGQSDPCPCLHAEVNALMKVPQPTQVKHILFVTCPPCEKCAGYIVNSKIVIEVVSLYDELTGSQMRAVRRFETAKILFSWVK